MMVSGGCVGSQIGALSVAGPRAEGLRFVCVVTGGKCVERERSWEQQDTYADHPELSEHPVPADYYPSVSLVVYALCRRI